MADDSVASASQAKDLRPIPDPSTLTTAQINREVAGLREILEARMDGMDARFVQLHVEFDKVPVFAGKIVQNLKELHGEKFQSIQTQFTERDTRTEQTSRDSKVAVDAALSAAKEAVSAQTIASQREILKSETATTKQIDSILSLIQSNTKASDDKIDSIKSLIMAATKASDEKTTAITNGLNEKISSLERQMALIDGRGAGMSSLWGFIVGAIGLVGALIAIFVRLAN